MHWGRFWLTTCLFTASAGAASTPNITAILSELPSCAFGCVLSGLSSSPTALTNITSTCSNITLQATLSACIQGHCNYTEQSQVAVVNDQLCAGVPIVSRSTTISIVGLVCGPLAVIAVIFRCFSRYSTTQRLAADDWIVIAAAVILIALTGIDVHNGLKNGYGRHYWNVDPLRIVQLLKIFYVGEFLYIIIITLVKASILIFYLRIFPNKWFKIADLIVLGTVIAFGVSISFAIVFQCNPVSGVWNKTMPSKCININALGYAAGGISVVQDVVILLLPIPELISLRMNMKRKLNVLFMFNIGIIACITSIVRLKYLITFAKSTDPTFDNALPAIWSFLEICVAMICVCLPSIRQILARWLPSIFDLTTSSRSEPRKTSTHPYASGTQRRFKAEKAGPSYDKRVICTPDDELLAATPRFENFWQDAPQKNKDGTETKIWINPKFDKQGNVVDCQTPDLESQPSVPSIETSVWALEGVRESEEIDVSGGRSIAMRDIGSDLSKPNFDPPEGRSVVVDPRFQRVLNQKDLPSLPAGPELREAH